MNTYIEQLLKPGRGYLGGFFDGEGSIGIFSGSICARVTNTDLAILHHFQDRWGGTIVSHTRATERRKECYQWKCYGPTAEKFLKDIFPFLREKRIQGFLALEYRRLAPSDPKRAWIATEISTIKHLGRTQMGDL